MKFGVFDQNDFSGSIAAVQYEERFKLAKIYEDCGFHCYHLSEHHGTPLSATPSPSVFLAALSQRTKTLRFGPLVYLLPGYNPLRLTEEILMLDNLSNGRFEFGVGRGASPHEMEFLGVVKDQALPMYMEAFNIIMDGLKNRVVNHSGKYWSYDNVALPIEAVQKPHPPLWIALSSAESAVWPARYGANIVTSAPAAAAKAIFDRFKAERAELEDAKSGREPLMGVSRTIIVAETDEEAKALGRRVWPHHYANFIALWNRYGTRPTAINIPETFEDIAKTGFMVAGSPETVHRNLLEIVQTSGASYLIGNFAFGSMKFDEVKRSVELFSKEVAPKIKAAHETSRIAAAASA